MTTAGRLAAASLTLELVLGIAWIEWGLRRRERAREARAANRPPVVP